MKSTLFCYCLAILIVASPNSTVRSLRLSQSSAKYTGISEQNKITNSSYYSKVSTTDPQSFNRKSYESTEKQDTKRDSIELSTTKYQNLQRSNVKDKVQTTVSIAKAATTERGTSTQPTAYPSSPSQNRKPSELNLASDFTSNAPNSRTSTPSRPATAYSTSLTAGRGDNRFASSTPSGFRTESTTYSTTEKWTSAPSSRTTSAQFSSQPSRATTPGAFTSSSSSRGQSTTASSKYSSSTESSATRPSKTSENDGVVFPAVTSKTVATRRPTSTQNGNEIPSGSTTEWPPLINGTSTTGNLTEVTEHRTVFDVPELGCPAGFRRDSSSGSEKCRKEV